MDKALHLEAVGRSSQAMTALSKKSKRFAKIEHSFVLGAQTSSAFGEIPPA